MPSIAWRVETARAHEASLADDLLQRVRERVKLEPVAMDKGYDTQPIHDACHAAGCPPIVPLKLHADLTILGRPYPSPHSPY